MMPVLDATLEEALADIGRPFLVQRTTGTVLPAHDEPALAADFAHVTACPLENLGDPTFRADHRLRYAYVAGAMANGIGSAEIVEAMGRAGMLGVLRRRRPAAAERVEAAIDRLTRSLGERSLTAST